jgi:hypothetical protein
VSDGTLDAVIASSFKALLRILHAPLCAGPLGSRCLPSGLASS